MSDGEPTRPGGPDGASETDDGSAAPPGDREQRAADDGSEYWPDDAVGDRADGRQEPGDDAGGDATAAAARAAEASIEDDASDRTADDAVEADPSVLRARVDVLARENERLREEYVRARRTQYRRSALALGLLGLLALGGAVAFVEYRELLLALGGTGLFGAALTVYLTPERFVASTVAERIHAAHAATQQGLLDDLGLHDERVYVPTPEAPHPARLFVPQRPEYDVPDAPEHVLVVPESPTGRGVALVPTGAPLYEEFEATVTGEPADDPAALAAQLADAVVETFELADAASTEPDLAGGRVVLTVSEPLYGDLDVPDHPIVSIVGTGLAAGLDDPVTATASSDGEAGRVVFEWSETARA